MRNEISREFKGKIKTIMPIVGLLRIGKGTNGIVNRWIKNAFYSLYNVGAYSKNLPKNAKIKIIMQRLDTKKKISKIFAGNCFYVYAIAIF